MEDDESWMKCYQKTPEPFVGFYDPIPGSTCHLTTILPQEKGIEEIKIEEPYKRNCNYP